MKRLKPEQWYLICPGCGGIVGLDLSLVNPRNHQALEQGGKPALENPAASARCSSPLLLFWTSQLGFRQAIRSHLDLLTWGNKCAEHRHHVQVWQLMLAKINARSTGGA